MTQIICHFGDKMKQIKVQQVFMALAHNYKLYKGDQEIGEVKGKLFKIRSSYTGYKNGQRFFKIQRNLWRTKYKIVDGAGQYLAHVKVPWIAFCSKKIRLHIGNKWYLAKGGIMGWNFQVIDPDTNKTVIDIKKHLGIRDAFLIEYADNIDTRIAVGTALAADDRYHPTK